MLAENEVLALRSRLESAVGRRLTAEQRAALIRDFIAEPGVTMLVLAERYKISRATVARILRRAAR